MKGTVLITGGAGFIGSHVAAELLKAGYHVRVLDSLVTQVHGETPDRPSYLHRDAEFILGDVRNPEAVDDALAGVDAVYHFVALVGRRFSARPSVPGARGESHPWAATRRRLGAPPPSSGRGATTAPEWRLLAHRERAERRLRPTGLAGRLGSALPGLSRRRWVRKCAPHSPPPASRSHAR